MIASLHGRFATVMLLLFLGLLATPCCSASGVRDVENFSPVTEQVRAYAKEFGPANVLLVADIDNTLLAMDSQLGSDQWYEWQDYLLKHEPKSKHLVAKDKRGLLAVQGLLFATTHMHPPEPEQPIQMAAVQAIGVSTVLLTSRGDDFRAATIRELRRNGYDFSDAAPSIRLFSRSGNVVRETASRFTPYQIKKPKAVGLTAEEVRFFGLSDSPRQVSYGDGVMMVAGQHKGAMLLVLLHLMEKEFEAIVYVDDHGRHVQHVFDALVRRDIEVTAMHYKHEDARVKSFEYGDKNRVTKQWRKIDQALRFFESAAQ